MTFSPTPPTDAREGLGHATWAIAAGTCIASFAVLFWIPFVPLYIRELGAASNADALVWVALANAGLGVGRLISGPLWGILADRFGRKLMFVRALCFASLTMFIGGFAQAPWHIVVSFVAQGLFSGFVPAAIALTSVSVPDTRMSRSLSAVTGAQHVGNMVGPSVGALLAVSFGYRGAIFAGAVLPMIAAVVVLILVPADHIDRPGAVRAKSAAGGPPLWRTLKPQFYLAVFVFFLLFALDQLVRLSAPGALQEILGRDNVAGTTGLAFTSAGVAAVTGVVLIGQRFVIPGRLRLTLLLGTATSAALYAVLALAHSSSVFIFTFAGLAFAQATMVPAANALIAANVPRERRGTGFGIASSAQALSFLIGPTAAAAFAATSLRLGFVALAGVLLALCALLFATLREPRPTA